MPRAAARAPLLARLFLPRPSLPPSLLDDLSAIACGDPAATRRVLEQTGRT